MISEDSLQTVDKVPEKSTLRGNSFLKVLSAVGFLIPNNNVNIGEENRRNFPNSTFWNGEDCKNKLYKFLLLMIFTEALLIIWLLKFSSVER